MLRLFSKKGQSTLEYALLVAVVVGGLIAMQVYMKRGLQGRLRSASDDIGDQYSPGNTTSTYTTETSTQSLETVMEGVTSSDMETTQTRIGSEEVAELELESESWPD